jgi:hypothetical protein
MEVVDGGLFMAACDHPQPQLVVVIERKDLNPCGEVERGREGGFFKGRRRHSRIAGERREMGR